LLISKNLTTKLTKHTKRTLVAAFFPFVYFAVQKVLLTRSAMFTPETIESPSETPSR